MEYIFVTSLLQGEGTHYSDNIWPGERGGGGGGVEKVKSVMTSLMDNP